MSLFLLEPKADRYILGQSKASYTGAIANVIAFASNDYEVVDAVHSYLLFVTKTNG